MKLIIACLMVVCFFGCAIKSNNGDIDTSDTAVSEAMTQAVSGIQWIKSCVVSLINSGTPVGKVAVLSDAVSKMTAYVKSGEFDKTKDVFTDAWNTAVALNAKVGTAK